MDGKRKILISPTYLFLIAFLLFFSFFSLFQFIYSWFQHFHCSISITMLWPFTLALHTILYLTWVILTALSVVFIYCPPAQSPKCVNSKIFVINFNFYVFINFGIYPYTWKLVCSLIRVKGDLTNLCFCFVFQIPIAFKTWNIHCYTFCSYLLLSDNQWF